MGLSPERSPAAAMVGRAVLCPPRLATECEPYLLRPYPLQPAVSKPLLKLSSVAASLTIRCPFVMFVLTLSGRLPG